MNKLITLIASIAVLIGFVAAPPVLAADAFSGSKDAVCAGIALQEGKTCEAVTTGKKDPMETVKLALNIFSAIIAIIGVVMVMIGGVKYVTSQGESAQVNNAKNTILYAAIGLAVAALSQIVVKFVLAKFGK